MIRRLYDWFLGIPWVFEGLRPIAVGGFDFAPVYAALGVTAADVVYTLESSTSFEDFRNYVLAIVQREHQTTMAIVADFGSHKTDTDDRYIGEDWWAVVLDEDAASAPLLAQRELTERQKWANLLVWKTSPKEVGPDNFVKVQTDNLNVPTDTIFQVVAESGRWSELEAEVEYVGKVIQYGP